MAQRFLAIDWDQNQLHVVSAIVSGGSVRFTRAVVLDEGLSPGPGQAEEAGRLLRERLKEFDFVNAPVLACVARDRVILKELHYPAVPPHEEPGVVRFQAIKELTDSAEDVVIDYVPLPPVSGFENRAQVVVARRELVAAYQALCQAAGLRLAGLVPRPYAMAGCLRGLLGTSPAVPPPDPADSAVAIVTVGEKWAELAVFKGDALLQARALGIGPGLAGEIKRNLAVHAGQQPNAPVRAVYLALSGEQAALRERLVETLDIPVHPFDPFGGAATQTLPSGGRGAFAGAVGLLHLAAARRGEMPVNFVQVKQPRAPKDPNQRLHLLAAALVLILVIGAGVVGFLDLKNRRDELTRLEGKLEDYGEDLKRERDKRKRLVALSEWNSVPWADELMELGARLPKPSNDFQLKKLSASVVDVKPVVSGPAAARKETPPPREEVFRPAAKVKLEVFTPASTPLDDLRSALKTAGDLTDPAGVGPQMRHYPFYEPGSPTKERNEARKYSHEILIRRRPPADYADEAAAGKNPEDRPAGEKQAAANP